MSDAIVLDVADTTPVRLDAGDADPIAREEIAALAGRVTTVEGAISALDGRMDAAEGEISTLGTTVDGIDARVEAIEADYVTAEDVMGALGGEAPTLVAGSATGVTGDVETASWMARQTYADGAALIESVKGNTLRWNQLFPTLSSISSSGITMTANGDGSYTLNGTATADFVSGSINNTRLVVGHKYLVLGESGEARAQVYDTAGHYAGSIFTSNKEGCPARIVVLFGKTVTNAVVWPQLFDLTQMFGAGNEPSTVAEFEALFPLPYYPYDAGSLLPVRMEGVETVGFNQWDEVAEDGYISDSTGENVGNNTAYLRSKDYIPVFPGMAYHFTLTTGTTGGKVYYYDADKAYLSFDNVTFNGNDKTTPSNARYMRFWLNYPGSYNHDICINLSNPARNGTYEPHWSSQRAIPASTYFPDGMRGVGTGDNMVCDELTEHEAIHRVGEVTFDGSSDESWGIAAIGSGYRFSSKLTNSVESNTPNRVYASCNRLDLLLSGGTAEEGANGFNISSAGYFMVALNTLAPSVTTVEQLRAWLAQNPLTLHYALATPTTTPIDPALPLSYRTGAGGTERVMVAEGTTSAPPIFATRYPLDPADLAASIAPVDGPTAKTNHQVGDLLMLGFTLCKATQVIVTGETIEIGTNVTKTSVAAEIAALS